MITDSTSTMPDGWLVDEPEYVADETSEKPGDWDEEMDGKWEPAKISEFARSWLSDVLSQKIPNVNLHPAAACGQRRQLRIRRTRANGEHQRLTIRRTKVNGKRPSSTIRIILRRTLTKCRRL
jgi:hypothetical protein